MEIKGKLVEKFAVQQVTDSFKKQEFVIEFAENPQYPEFVKFETIQDKCGQIDSYNVGSELTVSFNLKGRKWNDPKGGTKYFNTLQAWKLQAGTVATAPAPTSAAPQAGGMDQQEEPAWDNASEGDSDDLPF
jgi:hypothetical protein